MSSRRHDVMSYTMSYVYDIVYEIVYDILCTTSHTTSYTTQYMTRSVKWWGRASLDRVCLPHPTPGSRSLFSWLYTILCHHKAVAQAPLKTRATVTHLPCQTLTYYLQLCRHHFEGKPPLQPHLLDRVLVHSCFYSLRQWSVVENMDSDWSLPAWGCRDPFCAEECWDLFQNIMAAWVTRTWPPWRWHTDSGPVSLRAGHLEPCAIWYHIWYQNIMILTMISYVLNRLWYQRSMIS